MHKSLFVIGAGSVLALATALPAAAAPAPAPPPTTTFTVAGGVLTISVPGSVSLGSGSPGSTIGPTALGAVTVTDSRALLLATWTATVSSTSFTSGSGSNTQTIPVGDATYTTGVPATTGTIVATPTPTVTLSSASQTVVAGTAGVGNNSATWNPAVAIAVPGSAVVGTYTGTISHSVA